MEAKGREICYIGRLRNNRLRRVQRETMGLWVVTVMCPTRYSRAAAAAAAVTSVASPKHYSTSIVFILLVASIIYRPSTWLVCKRRSQATQITESVWYR